MAGPGELSLQDGARVAVVGAGPAGSLFAYFLLKEAAERGLSLDVVLYDGKPFGRSGPPGCNMCAGIVASTLVQKLQAIGFDLPEGVVQRHIGGYRLETPVGDVSLLPPEGSGPIYTIYRGNGPRGSVQGENVSFDDYLLQQVKRLGVTVVNEPVQEIRLPRRPEDKALVVRQSGAAEAVDLVVGAFGVHGSLARRVSELGFGYRPPPTTYGYQAELWWGEASVSQNLGNAVHVYALGLKGVQFAALTPKREYVTVTLIGPAAGPEALKALLEHPLVARRLPSGWRLPASYCQCRPRVPMGRCRHPFTDRLVIVGDASDSRLYKNGLESAYTTGRAAAETAVRYGVSGSAWESHYYPTCREIVQDSLFGRSIFWMKDHILSFYPVARVFLEAARCEQRQYPPSQRPVNRILWSTLTGDLLYRQVVGVVVQPLVMLRVLRLGMRALWGGRGTE